MSSLWSDVRRGVAPLVLVLALTGIACGGPEPKTAPPGKDGVAPPLKDQPVPDRGRRGTMTASR